MTITKSTFQFVPIEPGIVLHGTREYTIDETGVVRNDGGVTIGKMVGVVAEPAAVPA